MFKKFDMSRPVPWLRLVREWLIYVAIAATVLFLMNHNRVEAGLFAGLLVSGPMYLAFGALLAKMGYQRKTFKDLRAQREIAANKPAVANAGVVRQRPAPTKRTSGGTARSAKPQPRRPSR